MRYNKSAEVASETRVMLVEAVTEHEAEHEAPREERWATSDAFDPLPALCLIARLHQVAAEPEALRHALGKTASDVLDANDLLLAAKHLGLKAKRHRSSPERLNLVALPALALLHDGRWVVLAQCDGQRVLFQDVRDVKDQSTASATTGIRPTIELLEVFAEQVDRRTDPYQPAAPVWPVNSPSSTSPGSFPAMVKYRQACWVRCCSSASSCSSSGWSRPLFSQVVMDKVLVHRGLTTLDVLVIGLVIVVIFESVLGALRTYVFSHTTSRIDVELGATLVPPPAATAAGYFQARRVGDSVARVRELENIRSFLTGNALTRGAGRACSPSSSSPSCCCLQRAAHPDRAGESAAVLWPVAWLVVPLLRKPGWT